VYRLARDDRITRRRISRDLNRDLGRGHEWRRRFHLGRRRWRLFFLRHDLVDHLHFDGTGDELERMSCQSILQAIEKKDVQEYDQKDRGHATR
jgi:hypothetical protein